MQFWNHNAAAFESFQFQGSLLLLDKSHETKP